MTVLVDCPHCSTRVLPMAGRVCPACRRNVNTPPDPEPKPEQVVEDVYSLAAEQMRNGVAPAGIEKILIERGLNAEAAATFVSDLEQLQAKAHREAGRKMMLSGIFWGIGGGVVTALTYSAAAGAGGGTYVVAWGAILYGGIQFLRGFFEIVKG